MEISTIIILLVIWYIIGIISFIYWWTKDFDLTMNEFLPMLGLGVGGPTIWIIGWAIHGDNLLDNRIIFKKKNLRIKL